MKAEHDLNTSYLRLLAYPFNEALTDFIQRHHHVYIVDQNRDGQLFELIRSSTPAELVERLRSVRYFGGLPLDASTVTESVVEQEGL